MLTKLQYEYIRVEANPMVCLGLLQKLLELKVNLKEMKEAASSLQETLDQLLSQNEELRLYVQKLEEQHGFEGALPGELLEGTDKIIKEVEDFLKRERQ